MRKTLTTIVLTVGLIAAGAPAFADTYLDQPACTSSNDTVGGVPCSVGFPAPSVGPSYLDQPICTSAADNADGSPCVVGFPQSGPVAPSINDQPQASAARHHRAAHRKHHRAR